MKKMDVKPNKDDDAIIESANFDDFNFRVTLKNEVSVSKTGKIGIDLFSNWHNTRKVFRFINRVTFIHPESPFQIELSIVRTSTKNDKGSMIQTHNIEESNVFNNPESYEIEIEVRSNVKLFYKEPAQLSSGLQKMVKTVLYHRLPIERKAEA